MSASHIRVRPVDALLANVDKPLRKIARTIAKAHRADIDDLHQIALETALNLAPSTSPTGTPPSSPSSTPARAAP